MNKNAMYERKHTFIREQDELLVLDVSFVFPVDPRDYKTISEIMKKVELFLGDPDGINFVKAQNSPRCFYCSTLVSEGQKNCENCGAVV